MNRSRRPSTENDQRALLSSVDPAAPGRSPSVDPTSLEVVMSEIVSSHQSAADPTSPAGARPRGPGRSWFVAAAAAAVLVGAGVGLAQRGPASAPAKPPVALTVAAADASASCLPITVEGMRGADTAFSGTVESVGAGIATITVDRWYRGGGGSTTVTVTAPTGDETALVGLPQLTKGTRYLLVAGGGQISGCGANGEWTQDLANLYEQAF